MRQASPMIVAVTGAKGFIGQHLIRRFGEVGWIARAVVRADYAEDALENRFAGADVVVHAAGATRAPSTAELRASNVALTAHTLDAARRAGVRRFVFVSSQAAAGPASALDQPVTESSTPAPIEAYGESKLEAEQLVRSAAGVETVIVRPAAVYGPGDRDFLAAFRLAARGVAIHPGNRSQWISLIHVADAADAIVGAAQTLDVAGQTLFLANDQPVQWRELIPSMAKCAGRKLMLDVDVPRALVGLGAAAGDVLARMTGRAGLLTSEKVALARPRYWVCSNQRAKHLLGFGPRVELQRGLCDTYHWYRDNGWL